MDAGDDSVLPLLADELEWAGDPRADGLRLITHRPACIFTGGPRKCGWISELTLPTEEARQSAPSRELYRRLGRRSRSQTWIDSNGTLRTVWAVSYPTRHAAFLALAQALLEESRT